MSSTHSFLRVYIRLFSLLFLFSNLATQGSCLRNHKNRANPTCVNDRRNSNNNNYNNKSYNNSLSLIQEQGPHSTSNQCFPAIGFKMPKEAPLSLDGWWCDMDTEYAFVGFSYEITACQSPSELERDFMDIRQRFQGRYVRIYGACDKEGFYDDVIDAAWKAEIGIHALVWFGFDGDNKWEKRRDSLIQTLHSNRLAKFVVRFLQFGSEPLFDGVLPPDELAQQVKEAKVRLSGLRIQVTVSDMAYGYQKNDGALSVLSAIDGINMHALPFFAQDASTAKNAWPLVMRDLNWFIQNGHGKKIYLSENGWPSTTYSGVEANSPKAVANVQNERDYFNLLDGHCQDFKKFPGGGVGWFAHIYSDNQEPGYGIYDTDGNLKFPFKPRIEC